MACVLRLITLLLLLHSIAPGLRARWRRARGGGGGGVRACDALLLSDRFGISRRRGGGWMDGRPPPPPARSRSAWWALAVQVSACLPAACCPQPAVVRPACLPRARLTSRRSCRAAASGRPKRRATPRRWQMATPCYCRKGARLVYLVQRDQRGQRQSFVAFDSELPTRLLIPFRAEWGTSKKNIFK